MASIILNAYKVSSMSLKNKLKNGAQIQLNTKYSHNVRFSKNNTCEGILTVEIDEKENTGDFSVNVTVQGLFSHKEGMTREQLHVETFRELFPYARMLVINMTAMAGMPPINIPPLDMEKQDIYRIDMPAPGTEGNNE